MTTRPLRVLVADDSITIRKRLIAGLRGDPTITVVAEATDGAEAVRLCAELRPDVVLLDIVMPRLDGVRATQEIMALAPTPILIVSSSESHDDALSSMSALAAGAVDALGKPRETESDAAFDARLLRAVRLVARIPVVTRRRTSALTAAQPESTAATRPNSSTATAARGALASASERAAHLAARAELLAIGGSTGGPAAAVEFLQALPAPFPLPVVLVLHMGPAFGFAFAEWLNGMVPHPVVMAGDGLSLRAGHIHVAPPERHLVVRGGVCFASDAPERHSCRPSVDVLFESVAHAFDASAIGCLLTGIGRDGAEGLSRMRARGALTYAQDEASCAVFGMPREAILRGAALHVLPPAEMARHLAEVVRSQRSDAARDPRSDAARSDAALGPRSDALRVPRPR